MSRNVIIVLDGRVIINVFDGKIRQKIKGKKFTTRSSATYYILMLSFD